MPKGLKRDIYIYIYHFHSTRSRFTSYSGVLSFDIGEPILQEFPVVPVQEDVGSIPGSERSPGKGNGNSLQLSCLGNPMGRGAWWATVHEVSKELDMT